MLTFEEFQLTQPEAEKTVISDAVIDSTESDYNIINFPNNCVRDSVTS